MNNAQSIDLTYKMPKVCVPVMSKHPQEALPVINELMAESDCDVIEWRLDALGAPLDISEIQKVLERADFDANTSILLTMRTKNEGGLYQLEGKALWDYYLALTELPNIYAIDVQFRDIKDSGVMEALKKRGINTVLSWHDFAKTPGEAEIIELALEMSLQSPTVVKLAFMPRCEADAEAVMSVGGRLKSLMKDQPYTLISMGELGQKVRIKAEKAGSCFTFGCRPGEESAPGQVEYHRLKRLLEEEMS